MPESHFVYFVLFSCYLLQEDQLRFSYSYMPRSGRLLYLHSTFIIQPCTQVFPYFSKVRWHHFTYTKDLHYHFFLLTKRNLKKIFVFRKNGEVKLAFSVCFAMCLLGVCTIGSDTTKLVPKELHFASQHLVTIALNCVCEQLCFISISFIHLLARYVLMQLLLLLHTVLAYKSFHRNTTFK